MAAPTATTPRKWTLDQWLQAELEPRCELEEGKLVPMASPTRRHQRLLGRLYGHLDRWATEQGAGSVEMEVDVALPTGVGYIPDLSFIRAERIPQLITPDGKIRGAPDLVVEIISPTTRLRDTVRKLREYHAAQVAWYWLIDSETLSIQELQWTPDGYIIVSAAEASEPFRSRALAGVELDLRALAGDD